MKINELIIVAMLSLVIILVLVLLYKPHSVQCMMVQH